MEMETVAETINAEEAAQNEVNRAESYLQSYYRGFQYASARNCIKKALLLNPNQQFGHEMLVTTETLYYSKEHKGGNKSNEEVDWYSILHINSNACTSLIKMVGDDLCLRIMPSRYNKFDFPKVGVASKDIKEAMRVLCDEGMRGEFDRKRESWGLVDSVQSVCGGCYEFYNTKRVYMNWKPPVFVEGRTADVILRLRNDTKPSGSEEDSLDRVEDSSTGEGDSLVSGEEYSADEEENLARGKQNSIIGGEVLASGDKSLAKERVPLLNWDQGSTIGAKITSSDDLNTTKQGGHLASGGQNLCNKKRTLGSNENNSEERNASVPVSEGVDVGEESFMVSFVDLKQQVFEAMPHKPHYRPLANYHGIVLDGMKHGLDLAFVNLSEKIRGLVSPQSLWAGLKDLNEQFVELEVMGYDVSILRERLDKLQVIAKQEGPYTVAEEEFKADIAKEEEKQDLLRLRILEIQDELQKSEVVSNNRKRKIEQLENDRIMVVEEFKSLAKSSWK